MKIVLTVLISFFFVSCDSKKIEDLERINLELRQVNNSCFQDKENMEIKIDNLEYEINELEEDIDSLKSDIYNLENELLMRF